MGAPELRSAQGLRKALNGKGCRKWKISKRRAPKPLTWPAPHACASTSHEDNLAPLLHWAIVEPDTGAYEFPTQECRWPARRARWQNMVAGSGHMRMLASKEFPNEQGLWPIRLARWQCVFERGLSRSQTCKSRTEAAGQTRKAWLSTAIRTTTGARSTASVLSHDLQTDPRTPSQEQTRHGQLS